MELLVLLAGVWAVLALAFLHRKVKGYGPRTLHSTPAGDPAKGVVYAFTKGMVPWAKESVRMNLPSYVAGMAFHTGVFTAFGLLVAALARLELPAFLVFLARVLTAAGAIGGFSLLAKRAIKPQLRGLSSPDDFVSNLLSSLFVALACAQTFRPALDGIWMAEAVLLLLYAPLGKIRHCLFFFTTRYHLGAFFGRRGTFPPHA
jgi:hypothetical protein